MGTSDAFLAAVAGDGRGVLTITGPPGGGRTRLLEETARVAALLGHAVLPLHGHAGRRGRTYGALAEAADGRAALAAAGSQAEEIAAMLCARLARAGTQGLLVAVDDLAEVDAGTIAVLAALLRLPAPPPIALALVHAGPGAARGALDARVTAAVAAVPFSPAATRLWLRGVLAAEPPDALVAWLQEHAAGLPGRLRALAPPSWNRNTWRARGRAGPSDAPTPRPRPHSPAGCPAATTPSSAEWRRSSASRTCSKSRGRSAWWDPAVWERPGWRCRWRPNWRGASPTAPSMPAWPGCAIQGSWQARWPRRSICAAGRARGRGTR